jgi:hypothetical protein
MKFAGNVHRQSPVLAALAGLTVWPDSTTCVLGLPLYWPLTTTRSPSAAVHDRDAGYATNCAISASGTRRTPERWKNS